MWLQSPESNGVTMRDILRYKIYYETSQDNAYDNHSCQEDPFFAKSSLFVTIAVIMILCQSPRITSHITLHFI